MVLGEEREPRLVEQKGSAVEDVGDDHEHTAQPPQVRGHLGEMGG